MTVVVVVVAVVDESLVATVEVEVFDIEVNSMVFEIVVATVDTGVKPVGILVPPKLNLFMTPNPWWQPPPLSVPAQSKAAGL